MSKEEKELMKEIEAEVEALSEEDLAAEAKKIFDQQEKRRQYSKNRVMSPEAKEKQKTYRRKQYLKNKLIKQRYDELYGEPEVEAAPEEVE